jgi:hypothetical protein
MPRHVLDNGRDAAGKQSFGDRSAHRRDALWPRGESPAADGRVRSSLGDIEHRGAIDGDSDLGQIESDKASDKMRSRFGSGRLQPRLYRSCCGVSPPVRRRQALNPAALLIDQNRRIGSTDAFAKRPRQRAYLFATCDVALKKDQAPWVFTPEQRALLRVEREARAAADKGLRH